MVEGDAYLTMGLWAQANLSAAEMAQLATRPIPRPRLRWPSCRRSSSSRCCSRRPPGSASRIADWSQGGFAAIDKRFAAPPDSTEQILHADKLAAGEKPVVVTFPEDLAARLGAGWKVVAPGHHGRDAARDPAAGGRRVRLEGRCGGWGGDRVALLEGPDGALGVVLDTAWDTEADAAEFQAALEPLVAKLQASGRSAAVLVPEPDRVVLVSGSSDDVLGRVANVLGLAQ